MGVKKREIGQQLTLMQFEIFLRIRQEELLDKVRAGYRECLL
jgi:hypothetical protein